MNDFKLVRNTASIKQKLGDPACLEQIAEEAAELAHAALKLARVIRGENPTPVEEPDAYEALNEEFADVVLAAYTFGLMPDLDAMFDKRVRWIRRLFEEDSNE